MPVTFHNEIFVKIKKRAKQIAYNISHGLNDQCKRGANGVSSSSDVP